MDIKDLSDKNLIEMYGSCIRELKSRKIIRSKNVVGDLGEYLAIDHYCKTPGLPKLQPAPASTMNIDAISTKGERYSIKSTTSNTTGVFYGLSPKGSSLIDKQSFEYVIIVFFDDDYNLIRINELTWDLFLVHKRWHSRMNAWNLSITSKLLTDSKTIYLRGK
jgi:hypothetical protein